MAVWDQRAVSRSESTTGLTWDPREGSRRAMLVVLSPFDIKIVNYFIVVVYPKGLGFFAVFIVRNYAGVYMLRERCSRHKDGSATAGSPGGHNWNRTMSIETCAF
jgi:hypothetical protein